MAANGKVKRVGKSEKKGLLSYFRSLKAEFKRITWPQKKEVKKAFGAVIVFCVFYLAIITVADFTFNKLFTFIFSR